MVMSKKESDAMIKRMHESRGDYRSLSEINEAINQRGMFVDVQMDKNLALKLIEEYEAYPDGYVFRGTSWFYGPALITKEDMIQSIKDAVGL